MSEAALLAAHAAGDAARMARLYRAAARNAGGEARAFLLTHAWVHALDAGCAWAGEVEAELRGMGRA